jgi:hypothetical protein
VLFLTSFQVRVDNFCQACEDDAFKAAGEQTSLWCFCFCVNHCLCCLAGYKGEEKAFEIEAAYEG